MFSKVFPFVAVLATVAAPRAQTFVVDALNGPGTHFTTLTAAVAAVPDGAVLLVRPGSYAGFSVSGRGLAILADPGTVILDTIAIANTQPHQSVMLRRLQWATAQLAAGNVLLSLDMCAGRVHLEELDQPPHLSCLPSSTTGCDRTTGVAANVCARLSMSNCTIRCGVALTDTDAAIVDCTLVGEPRIMGFSRTVDGRTPLRLSRSRVQVAGNSTIRGGDGDPTFGLGFAFPGNAVFAADSELRLLGGSVLADEVFYSVVPFAPYTVYVWGASTVRISPRVQLSQTLGPTLGTDVMPQLTGAGAAANGNLTARVATETGDLVILAVGLPGAPTAIPGVRDAFWLDANAHVFQAIGVQTTTPIAASIQVPASPSFQGFALVWQAACFGPLTGFQATNPILGLVH